MNIVRQHDHDRFLLSLMAQPHHRPALWALFAFNYEIAKTREVVSDTTIGLIRMRWWHDAIAEIYDGKKVRRHEVVDELAKAIREYDLPREDFDNLIYAREFDLEGVAPASLEGFINYCNFTTMPLMHLVSCVTSESVHESILKHESIRNAALGLIRAVPYMRSQRRVMLPQDILAKNNLSPEKLCDFNKFEKVPDVIKEILDGINQFRYDHSLPKTRFFTTLKKMNDLYQTQIESLSYDAFNPALGVPPRFMALRLWLSR